MSGGGGGGVRARDHKQVMECHGIPQTRTLKADCVNRPDGAASEDAGYGGRQERGEWKWRRLWLTQW